MLKAPQPSENQHESFVYQVCISGSIEKKPFDTLPIGGNELTNSERMTIVRDIVSGFAEPFRSFLSHMSDDTRVKRLELDDYVPRQRTVAAGTYTLVGDAAHAMAMCKLSTSTTSPVSLADLVRI